MLKRTDCQSRCEFVSPVESIFKFVDPCCAAWCFSQATYHYVIYHLLPMRLFDFLISRVSSFASSNREYPSQVTVPKARDFSGMRMLMTAVFGRHIGRKLIESGHTGTIVMLFVSLDRIGPFEASEYARLP